MILTAEQVKASWNVFAPTYSVKDSVNLTFYYTLVNMLHLHQAKHILQVGCGTGKMIPYALSIKDSSSTYLATDLCENMIELVQKTLKTYLQKFSVQQPLQQWMKRHNLALKVANADLPIESSHKFDRIIANLMIQLAQDPVKTLKNLYQMAQPGCLLGITTWGNPQKNNFFSIFPQAMKAKGIQSTTRSNFHLYGRLQQVANEAGWQVVVRWQQNAPFAFLEFDQSARGLINYFTKGDEFLVNFFIARMKQIFANKQTINFSADLAILRKK